MLNNIIVGLSLAIIVQAQRVPPNPSADCAFLAFNPQLQASCIGILTNSTASANTTGVSQHGLARRQTNATTVPVSVQLLWLTSSTCAGAPDSIYVYDDYAYSGDTSCPAADTYACQSGYFGYVKGSCAMAANMTSELSVLLPTLSSAHYWAQFKYYSTATCTDEPEYAVLTQASGSTQYVSSSVCGSISCSGSSSQTCVGTPNSASTSCSSTTCTTANGTCAASSSSHWTNGKCIGTGAYSAAFHTMTGPWLFIVLLAASVFVTY